MERGEIWLSLIDEVRPVVLLSGGPEFSAVQVVEPASSAWRAGFVLISGEQAVDVDERRRIIAGAGPGIRAIGIEVSLGADEGLREDGVVRVALPQDGSIFCTWTLTVDAGSLIRRLGTLSPAKQHELDVALALAESR